MNLTEICSLLSLSGLVIYQLLSWNVTRLRIKYKVVSPSTSGPEQFAKGYRAHLNFGENLIIFIPLVWISGFLIGPVYTTIYAFTWLVGRLIWTFAYLGIIGISQFRYLGIGLTYGANVILILYLIWHIIL